MKETSSDRNNSGDALTSAVNPDFKKRGLWLHSKFYTSGFQKKSERTVPLATGRSLPLITASNSEVKTRSALYIRGSTTKGLIMISS